MGTRLQDRIAIVTGGASGIGEATTRRFAEEGASVVVADLDHERAESVANSIGDAAVARRVDVASEDDVAALVDGAVERFGRLDVMFNNAGILGAVGPIAEIDGDAWSRAIDVLLSSVFYGVKHAARVMIPQGSGAIVNTTSTAGVRAGLGPHVYTAAKHGVVGLTGSVAAELGPYGIRVNALAPGGTITALTTKLTTGDPDDVETATARIGTRSPMGRGGRAEEMADAVLYMVSDEATFLNGHTLVVDGGGEVNADRNSMFTKMPAILEQGRL